MFERPDDVTDDMVRDALREHWDLAAPSLEYAAVGFGCHHWLTSTYFASVHAAADRDELIPTLRTAQALRRDAELEFVIAPIPSNSGALVVPLGDDWLLHLYERLDVIDDTTHGSHHEQEVIDLVQRIHDATPVVEQHAWREDFSIPDRDDLEKALGELGEPWEMGPYGERCRQALVANADALKRALEIHDRWIDDVPRDGWVVTHGEPHRGNVFRTTRGWAVVDWDTVRVAPPERDWWDITNGPGDASRRKLYEFRWALIEVACYVSEFFDDHEDNRNTRESWTNFVHYLEKAVVAPT